MHYHHDIVSAAWITLMAVAGINVLRMLAILMVSKKIPGGQALGALVK